MNLDWSPFELTGPGERLPDTRDIHTIAGIGDRLRTAAFAELQAREAFLWAAERFEDAPETLREAWRFLSREEDKHLKWLFGRMEALGIDVKERKVSNVLWKSLMTCRTGKEFATFIATAEERGRKAGVRFREAMSKTDPESAQVFGKIAEEEVTHIEIATSHYGEEILLRATTAGLSALNPTSN